MSFGKEDRQTSPLARNNNVANQTAETGASEPEPSQLPEPLSWAPAPSADPYLNQSDHHLANINNLTLTNLPSITPDHQNVQYPVQNMQRSFYPMASHLLPNMSFWHVPHPATVTSSHPQQVQQQVLQTNMNKPVVSFSSGGITYYNQNPFFSATHIGQHSPSSSIQVQEGLYSNQMLPYAAVPVNNTGSFHSYHPSTLVAPTHDNSFNVKDLADAITSSQLNQLPKWTLAQYNGDLLLWHEWIGQFKIAKDSQNLSDAAKLTYLKTLLTGRAKNPLSSLRIVVHCLTMP